MQDLLLLHGAIGSKSQMQSLAVKLEKNYKVHSLDFTGHGGEKIPTAELSIALFGEQVLGYLNEKKIDRINIFGYSMGGYVAMWLAKHHPERIIKVITLATKFHWDSTVAANEARFLDPGKILEKLPSFAEELRQRHAPEDWRTILDKTKAMLLAMGENNPLQLHEYKDINNPCLILLGDRDKMITLDETVAVYKQPPAAQLGILPATPHPFEQVDINTLQFFINRFLVG